MIPGRFFTYDQQFKNYSCYYYNPVISDFTGRNCPIYLYFSSSFIGFYIHTEGISPLSQLLFYIPIEDQHGRQKPSEILKSIYNEEVENTSIRKLNNDEFRFLGYVQPYGELNKNTSAIHKKKLFLDFLFDITHSEVFDNWKHINKVKAFIYNDFFINAIRWKNEYVFSRVEYIKFLERRDQAKYSKIFIIRLKEAEENWLRLLFDGRANDFCFSNGWFDDVEEELKDVLFPKEKTMAKNFNRVKWQKKYFNIVTKDLIEYEKKKYRVECNRIFSFFLSRYELSIPYKIINQHSIILGWLGRFFFTKIFFGGLVCTAIISLFFKLFSISYLLLILGILGIWLIIFNPVILFIFLNIHKSISNEKHPPLDTIKIGVPKMTGAILVGWLALYPFSEELWEINAKSSDIYPWLIALIILLSTIIFITIFQEIKSIEPIQKIRKSLLKVIRVFTIGFSFSIGIGLILHHLGSVYMFDNNDFIISSYEGLKTKAVIKDIYERPKKIFDLKKKIEKLNSDSMLLNSSDLLISEFNTIKPIDPSFTKQFISLIKSDSILEFVLKKQRIVGSLKNQIDLLELSCYSDVKKEVESYIKAYSQDERLPIIASHRFRGFLIFIFPRLLIFNSLIAFIIGFFIQFISESRIYKEPL